MQHQGNELLFHTAWVPASLTLRQRRYLLLLEQLLEEAGGPDKHGARSAAGRRVGISQSHVTQLLEGSKRPADRIMDRAEQKLRLRPEFFHDPAVRAPRYVDYVRGGAQRVERDEELGHPAIENYIAAMEARGSPVLDDHQIELRSLRAALGPDSITEEVVRGFHRGLVARDANRAIEAPLVETEIDEERGQTVLQPLKKARR